jgi:hypothetical protein
MIGFRSAGSEERSKRNELIGRDAWMRLNSSEVSSTQRAKKSTSAAIESARARLHYGTVLVEMKATSNKLT